MFLGKISFGLYLIHLPVILSFSCWAYLETFQSLGSSASAMLVSAATCVISLALGYLFYVAVDRPAVGLSRRLTSPLVGASRDAVVFMRVSANDRLVSKIELSVSRNESLYSAARRMWS